MDNSFVQTQHPVVEELLTNKFFGDTLLVCANGHLTDNKLAVGLLFPALLTSDIFALPIENVLLVPDYTMEEIGREFEKLILGGSIPTRTSSSSSSSTLTTSIETQSTSESTSRPGSEGRQEPDRTNQTLQQDSPATQYSEYDTVVMDNNTLVNLTPSTASPSLMVPEYHHPGLSSLNTNSIDVISSMSAGTSVVNVNIPYTEPQQQQQAQQQQARLHTAVVPGPSSGHVTSPAGVLEPVQVEGGYGTYITLGESFYTEQNYDEDASDDLKNENNLVIDIDQDVDQPQVTVSNGYSDNCENIQISEETEASIQIYIENNHNQTQPPSSPGQKKAKKTVTFKEPERMVKRRTRTKQKVFIKEYEDYDVDMIENLREEGSAALDAAPESPILEERKPGRPRTKSIKDRPAIGEMTRYKKKATENLSKETYKCDECGKVLSCSGSLTRHRLVHADKKPFKCKYCPKAFREAFKKSTHERVHTGSKPYPCKLCSKSFRTATQRSIHQNTHTREKRVQCEHCSSSFTQKYAMKMHLKKFH